MLLADLPHGSIHIANICFQGEYLNFDYPGSIGSGSFALTLLENESDKFKADICALGMLFYFTTTGRIAFKANTGS